MNTRIKQLAEQAGAGWDHKYHWYVGSETMQKFAELIVRECVDKIETYRIPVGNSAAGEMAAEWTHDALWQIRDDIKQHFGVDKPTGQVCSKCGVDRTKEACPNGYHAALTGQCPDIGVAYERAN
jgi:hypothetical protein